MNSSSKFYRRPIIIGLFGLILLIFIAQISATEFLHKHKDKIENYCSSFAGYKISLDDIKFTFLNGLHLKNIRIYYHPQEKESLFLKNTIIKIAIIPLIVRKICIRKILVDEAVLISKKENEGISLQVIFSDIYKKIRFGKGPAFFSIDTDNLILNAHLSKIINVEERQNLAMALDIAAKDTVIAIREGKKINGESNLDIKFTLAQNNLLLRLSDVKEAQQGLRCKWEGEIIDNDLHISSLELYVENEQIFGSGTMKDFAERNPYLIFNIVNSAITANNIAFLKNMFGANDYILFSGTFSGPLDKIEPIIRLKLDNCDFDYRSTSGKIIKLENISGGLYYGRGFIKLDDLYLKLNKVPLYIKLSLSITESPEISLSISLPKEFLEQKGLSIKKFEAEFKGSIKDGLSGDLTIKTLYWRFNQEFEMEASFDNIEIKKMDAAQKELKIQKITLSKNNKTEMQELHFFDAEAALELNEKQLDIKNLALLGYNGTLKGTLKLTFENNPLINAVLSGNNLDVDKLLQDTRITQKILSGKLNTRIEFNNQEKDFLKGSCYIKNGLIDLDALSSVVKLPPLKEESFSLINLYFAVSKELVKIRNVRLFSPDIILDASWDIDTKIDGILNVKINSQLLKKSEVFRKLFNLTKINKPYIDFKFMLGGVPKVMRFMWLTGEFKDKLQEALPERIENLIEDSLNKLINEELANQQ